MLCLRSAAADASLEPTDVCHADGRDVKTIGHPYILLVFYGRPME